MNLKEIRLAVVGTGVWAQKIHYPTLEHLRAHPGPGYRLRLRGLCSLDRPAAERVAAQYHFERIYRDVDELIADAEIDAIAAIVMPRGLPALVARLQAKGVPLLTEKPPGKDSTQAAELSRMIRVPHVVGFNRRFAPLNARFAEAVARMKSPFFAEARFYRHGRLDPDFIRGTGIHMINLVECCFGPISRARTRRVAHPAAATWNWFTEVEFVSGVAAKLHFLPCTGTQVEQIEAHGPDQSIVVDGAMLGETAGRFSTYRTADSPPALAGTTLAPGQLPECGSIGGYQALFNPTTAEHVSNPPDAPMLVSCGFAGEYEELFSFVLGRTESRSTFRASLDSMRVADAIEAGVDYTRPTDA